MGDACGVMCDDEMKSALRVRAKMEGGQKKEMRLKIVLSVLNPKAI